MKSYMAFNQFGHQAVQSPSAGGYKLQNVFAFSFALKSAFNGINLTLNAAYPRQRPFLIFRGMRQGHLLTENNITL